MILLNLGCGGVRPPAPFVNLDNLHALFPEGRPERTQMDAEPNYVNCDLTGGIPFGDNAVDGILASHFFEHLDCQEGKRLLKDCYRVLVPGGLLVASVPDTSYFRQVHHEDTHANSGRLFGEQLDRGDPNTSFFDAALFFCEHKQLLTEDSLWALLRSGGFKSPMVGYQADSEVYRLLKQHLNRPRFSLVMWGVKE